MLGKKQNDTYYTIATDYNFEEKKLVTAILETDGKNKFEFIASYEQVIEPGLYSMLKKAKNYSFNPQEIAELAEVYSQSIVKSVTSILAENDMSIEEIDIVCLDNLTIAKNCKLEIASMVKQALNVSIVYNLDNKNLSEFLSVLAAQNKNKVDAIINLNQDFDIYTLNNDGAHFIGKSIGFSILKYLAMYLSVEEDKVSYLIGQGTTDEAIIKKIEHIENMEDLQKELLNIIMFSNISIEDKLKTAFEVIKMCLFGSLHGLAAKNNILIIGNTAFIEDLNQSLLSTFNNVTVLSNHQQRQHCVLNEYMAFEGAKKHTNVNHNNGVKII